MASVDKKEAILRLQKLEQLKHVSFKDFLEIGTVSGMTEGQIYIYSEEQAQIFPCWMLIVHISEFRFLWPILTSQNEEFAIAHDRWNNPCWQDLLVDEVKLPFICGKTYKFQVSFSSLRDHTQSLKDYSMEGIEQEIRKTYEKYAISLVPDQLGNVEYCRIVVATSPGTPQLIVGKDFYVANNEPERSFAEHAKFIKWEYTSTYNWRSTNVGTIVHYVPTIAVELDDEGNAKGRWLGQEIVADWKYFCDEQNVKGDDGRSEAKKLHGVKAQIGGLCLIHYNAKRLEIGFCLEK